MNNKLAADALSINLQKSILVIWRPWKGHHNITQNEGAPLSPPPFICIVGPPKVAIFADNLCVTSIKLFEHGSTEKKISIKIGPWSGPESLLIKS